MRISNLTFTLLFIALISSCTKEITVKPSIDDHHAHYEEIETMCENPTDYYVLMEDEEKRTKPTGDDDDEYILMEEVVNSSSTPVSGAEVKLTGHGTSLTQFTDINGQCLFSVTVPGAYDLEVSYLGTLYVSTSVSLATDTTQRTDVIPF
jgi:hypothetical protein